MMVVQSPVLPGEITDAIIDHLHSDLRALGVCSTVCSEWLFRCRHHVFSTVQLWPWRVNRFFDLAQSQSCTFTHYIHRIELDDSRARSLAIHGKNEDQVLFNDAMSRSHIPCLAQVKSIQVRNVDWTLLSPTEHVVLRKRLARLSKINRLEFHSVVFQDLREVIRIVDSFPMLQQLSANITFMKYVEHTIATALALRLPNNLQSIEVGTDDGIPVILSCISGKEGLPHVLALKLQNIKFNHLQYIRTTLRKAGRNLQQVSLNFEEEKQQRMLQDEFANTIDLSRLSHLRTLCIEGMKLRKSDALSVLETSLPQILHRIESCCLQSIDLKFHVGESADIDCFDWNHLERVLLAHHFFGMAVARIFVVVEDVNDDCRTVEQRIRKAMADLDSRGALAVQAVHDIRPDGNGVSVK
ncbi:hypothetical protein B0H34DRAFT_176697 [Crassisporium funariophilum]|nr:hypothetical protein B0H34DRAFT_283246 [Crassisporium funariophilum]KAF8150141.1 hypothetical protein B0H34DRAFT_176697 [Crassisporium funariophilum]